MNQTKQNIFLSTNQEDSPSVCFESDQNALVIVAHPDDETLWTGGFMLMYSSWKWRVMSLCRGWDMDRRKRFFNANTSLESKGWIGNLDDGPEQRPLDSYRVESEIALGMPTEGFDIVLTHSPFGEYTRHRRHEETGEAVRKLWERRVIRSKELWFFAYSDDDRKQFPQAIDDAHIRFSLPENIWQKKRTIVHEVYGFSKESWEYQTTPRQEAFWRFKSPFDALNWQQREESRKRQDGENSKKVNKSQRRSRPFVV